ncbi:MAG: hypothetical protein LJE93_16225 [Acidobacteria bacterium]|jgi:nucleotidyltransferase/DNA polymerase involved in DNA repair|nr:hypothetical protein [Acidobacteriota bacterium]
MADPTIPAVARVECRSEGRGEESPVAVVWGGQRLDIVDVIDRAVVTGVEAGEPVRHRFWVELEDGRRCELTRVDPGGEWRVTVEADPSS